jgi:hypothetical protein
MTKSPQQKRRWFQISLRTLMLLVTLVCVGFACYGPIARAKRQREAVERILAQRGKVFYDYQSPRLSFSSSQMKWDKDAKPPGPAWLRDFCGIDLFASVVGAELSALTLSGMQLDSYMGLTELRCLRINTSAGSTDKELVHIRRFRKLESLCLARTDVTDAGLRHVRGLTTLREIDLYEAGFITDAGLAHIEGLKQLRSLNLMLTQVTDAGMVHLRGLTNLRELNLCFTKVGDVGLAQLEALNNLEILCIRLTWVTDQGLRRLCHLPKLKELLVSPRKSEALQEEFPNVLIHPGWEPMLSED